MFGVRAAPHLAGLEAAGRGRVACSPAAAHRRLLPPLLPAERTGAYLPALSAAPLRVRSAAAARPPPYDSVGVLANDTTAAWHGRPRELEAALAQGLAPASGLARSVSAARLRGDVRVCAVLAGEGVGLVESIARRLGRRWQGEAGRGGAGGESCTLYACAARRVRVCPTTRSLPPAPTPSAV